MHTTPLPAGEGLGVGLLLSSYPNLWVQAVLHFTQLELKDIILCHRAQALACRHLLSALHIDRTQVAIYRYVGTMTHHNDELTAVSEHGTNLAVVYCACLAAGLTHNVYALVVYSHSLESCHTVLSVVAYDACATRDRHRKTTLVLLETARHHTVN